MGINYDGSNFSSKHSNSIIVVDEQKNIVTGVNTSGCAPWGEIGVFVKGIALSTSGKYMMTCGQDNRALDPMTLWLLLKNEEPFIAGSATGSSLFPADFQVISNIIDFDINIEEAVLKPRFGHYKYDLDANQLVACTVADKRYSLEIIKNMKEKGVDLIQEGEIDLGFPMLTMIDNSNGYILGMPIESSCSSNANGW